MDVAAINAYHGLFKNTGQTCCAPTRVFVQSGVYDKFVEKAVKLAESTKVGDAFASDSFQGPQVPDKKALNKRTSI